MKVTFVGVDSWNRPVFKALDKRAYFGSTDILFSHDTPEAEILEGVSAHQLEFFGSSFGCEPMGGKPSEALQIVESSTVGGA